MTLWWMISLGGVSFFATLFFGRNDFFKKPDRLNVRDTPLYKPLVGDATDKELKQQHYELDELPQEDVVYSGIRRLNQVLTFRLALNEPFAMFVSLVGIFAALVIFVIAVSTSLS